MDQMTRRSMAIPTGDASEIPAATSFIEGPNGRRPPQMNTQISGSSSQVSNLKELECHHKTKVVDTETNAKNKPTTRLWYKCKDVTRSVFRALGLAIIPHAFQSLSHHVTGKGLHEPIKVAVRKSYTIAILRGLIHVLPIGFALAEIILNCNTYYVGVSPYNQAIYQLLAKVHEIMIQASLATVILAYIRHEIAFGKGLPLGALVSGLQISQFAYLWSMEFWGTIRSTTLSISRKLKLLIVTLICFTLAILAGPSSAVLLIPRLDYWPAGSTDIWINATSDDLYPSLLDAAFIPDDCTFAPESSISNGCPSSEWESIQQYLAISKNYVPEQYVVTYDAEQRAGPITLSGKNSKRLLYLGTDLQYEPPQSPFTSTVPIAAVADALTTTSGLWFWSLANVTTQSGHGSPLSDQSDATQSLSRGSLQGLATGTCVPDLVLNETDKRPLALPLLYDANDPKLSDINITVNNWTGPAITHPDLTRDQILGDALNESQYFIRWIELPQDKFNGSSIGAAILLPQTKNLSLDQSWPHEMILCNFAAGWGTTSLQMDKSDSNADDRVSSKVVKIDTNWDDPGNREPGKGVTDVSSEAGHGDVLTYWDYPRYPQKSISIAQDWAQSLNPVVQSANKTVFHLIMQEQWDLAGSPFAPTVTVKAALTMLIANGLGRVGFNSTFQGNPKSITAPDGSSWIDGNYWLSGKGNVFTVDPEDAKEWVKFHVDSKLQGYAYNTQTVPPRLAIAVMIAYCIIALAHLLYAGITGKFVLISISEALDALALTFHSSTGISSTCWDSISELTVLAVNSAPTEALRNTCAGIRELHIFQLPVRVVAVPDKEGDGSHLELVFANDDTEGDRLKVNRKYGTMTSSLKQS